MCRKQLHFDRNAPVSVLDLMCAARSSRPVWLSYNKKAKAKALELLESVECSQIAGRRLGALSGGELQRVVLACALDPMPNLLLLDEPVSGFDREGLDMFYKLVSSLREKNHMAIMLISHDFETITRYADKVLLLGGRQLAFGTPQEVFTSAEFRHAFPLASGRID